MLQKKYFAFGALFCLLIGVIYWISNAYQKSEESDFIDFLVLNYHDYKYPNQVRVFTENWIDENDILIEQIVSKNGVSKTVIIYKNEDETGEFSKAKDKNTFLIYYKNDLIGSFLHFKGNKNHTFDYKIEFFEGEKQRINFIYSITRQNPSN